MKTVILLYNNKILDCRDLGEGRREVWGLELREGHPVAGGGEGGGGGHRHQTPHPVLQPIHLINNTYSS